MNDFENSKEKYPSKEYFHSSLARKKKLVTKNMNMFLMFGIHLKQKR